MPYSSVSMSGGLSATLARPRRTTRDVPYPVGNDVLPRPLASPVTGNVLVYFNVTGFCYDVQQPDPTQISAAPQLANVSAFVDFFPGNQAGVFPPGYSLLIPNLNHGDGTSGDTLVPLAPITARFLGGSLRTIVEGDPIGVLLLSNTPLLGMSILMYHVRFRNVTYGGTAVPNTLVQPVSQILTNFAIQASTDTTPLNLTGYNTLRFPYLGP